jgi:hypothetical protein
MRKFEQKFSNFCIHLFWDERKLFRGEWKMRIKPEIPHNNFWPFHRIDYESAKRENSDSVKTLCSYASIGWLNWTQVEMFYEWIIKTRCSGIKSDGSTLCVELLFMLILCNTYVECICDFDCSFLHLTLSYDDNLNWLIKTSTI